MVEAFILINSGFHEHAAAAFGAGSSTCSIEQVELLTSKGFQWKREEILIVCKVF